MFNKKDDGITDLAEICSKEKADEGIWKQAIICGKKKNFEVKIFGDDSDVVREYNNKKMRKQMEKINISRKDGVDMNLDEDSIDDLLENNIEPALIRFGGVRTVETGDPLTYNGKDFPVEKTKESEKLYEGLLNGSPALREFILASAKNRSDFLLTGKQN
jgi:hypothetical protein